MNGKTHMIVGGLSAGVPVVLSFMSKDICFDIGNCVYYPIAGVVSGIFGGIGPDIDMPHSIAGKWIRKALTAIIIGSGGMMLFLCCMLLLGSGTFKVLVPFFSFFLLGCFFAIFLSVVKHRRETHNGLLFIVLSLPLFWCCTFSSVNMFTNLLFSLWIGFIIGWFSHLVIDSFNKKGVPWLYPFVKKHYSIMSITTGTKDEDFFRMISILFFIILYFFIIIFWRLFL